MSKDRRLTQKQIERLLVNPYKLEQEQPKQPEPVTQYISFKGCEKDYDSLNSADRIKDFCSFIKDVVTRYEENQRLQDEAETMEMDLEHAIELAQKLTEKEKKMLYSKLTEVLQLRRACKSENEILQPLYTYFSDKILLNKLAQLQGTISSVKEIISNRTYSCRTSILEGFRHDETS